jgi:hypothetical protein
MPLQVGLGQSPLWACSQMPGRWPTDLNASSCSGLDSINRYAASRRKETAYWGCYQRNVRIAHLISSVVLGSARCLNDRRDWSRGAFSSYLIAANFDGAVRSFGLNGEVTCLESTRRLKSFHPCISVQSNLPRVQRPSAIFNWFASASSGASCRCAGATNGFHCTDRFEVAQNCYVLFAHFALLAFASRLSAPGQRRPPSDRIHRPSAAPKETP